MKWVVYLRKAKTALLTPIGPRWPLQKKNRYRGVALLMVLVGLMLMTSIVNDLSHQELVHYRLATYQRDAFKAEALAEGGIQFARLLVTLQSKVQPLLLNLSNSGVPLPSLMIWELLPLNSGTLQQLAEGSILNALGLDVEESIQKRKQAKPEDKKEEGKEDKTKIKQNKPKEEAVVFKKPESGFGAFEGGFDLQIEGEEGKFSFRDWPTNTDQNQKAARKNLLLALFKPVRYDKLFASVDRASLVGNIYDWIDYDDQRVDVSAPDAEFGKRNFGAEREIYEDDGPMPKNAYFDSLQELRLVKGFTDDHLKTFAPVLTLYGEGGKVNIFSAKDQMIEALILYCAINKEDPLLTPKWITAAQAQWKKYRSGGGGALSPKGFVAFLTGLGLQVDAARCEGILGTKSSNFIVESKAMVGNVSKTLTLVVRVDNGNEEWYYFRSN